MWRGPCGSRLRRPVILGIETSCDETAAAVVTRRRRDPLERRRLADRSCTPVYGGVVPEIASRRHLELVSPVVREALDRAGVTLERSTGSPSPAGPGLIGALLVGLAAAKGLAWGRGTPARPGRPPARSRRLALPPARPTSSRRSSACSRAAGTRCCSTSQDRTGVHACSARRSTTRPARRSTRARGCSASATPAAPRSTGSPATGDPEAYDFPVARVPGLDFSFSGLKTALLYAVRDLDPDELEARRADLAASYQRAIVRALVERAARRRTLTPTGRDRRRRRRQLRAPRRRCPRRSPRRSSSARTMPR